MLDMGFRPPVDRIVSQPGRSPDPLPVGAAASHLESSFSDEEEIVEVLASHYLAAYRELPDAEDSGEIKARAREMLRRAGERAASLAAAREAQRYFQQAAELDRGAARSRRARREGGPDGVASRAPRRGDCPPRRGARRPRAGRARPGLRRGSPASWPRSTSARIVRTTRSCVWNGRSRTSAATSPTRSSPKPRRSWGAS